jgi:hypothetical protein
VTQALGKKGGRLWKHADFMRFWFGMSVSNFGKQITSARVLSACVFLSRLHLNSAQKPVSIVSATEN